MRCVQKVTVDRFDARYEGRAGLGTRYANETNKEREETDDKSTHLVAGSVARAIAAFHPFANSCKSVYSAVAAILIFITKLLFNSVTLVCYSVQIPQTEAPNTKSR